MKVGTAPAVGEWTNMLPSAKTRGTWDTKRWRRQEQVSHRPPACNPSFTHQHLPQNSRIQRHELPRLFVCAARRFCVHRGSTICRSFDTAPLVGAAGGVVLILCTPLTGRDVSMPSAPGVILRYRAELESG